MLSTTGWMLVATGFTGAMTFRALCGDSPDTLTTVARFLALHPRTIDLSLGRIARLLAAQLKPEEGGMAVAGKMRVGYFTQYQVEELHSDDTPFDHMQRLMEGEKPSFVRAQLGRFGFAGDKAMTKVGKLSGGERARLALALITRDAPHMLILDEPTNHLDMESIETLEAALRSFDGALLVVSHDQRFLDAIGIKRTITV